jgi:hypothetical protein
MSYIGFGIRVFASIKYNHSKYTHKTMSILQAAQLSCDVYKSPSRILSIYKNKNVSVLEHKSHPLLLTMRDNKDLYVAFRGCKDAQEFLKSIDAKMVSPKYELNAKVKQTFWKTFEDVKDELAYVIHQHEIDDVENIIFTGHSKGGALAQIASSMLDIQHKQKQCISFGAPYVGDKGFQQLVEQQTRVHKRIVAKGDIIPVAKLHKELVHNGEELILHTSVSSPLTCIEHHSCQNYIDALRKMNIEN